MEFVKVLIVGGGVAGLGAAKILSTNVDYVLIEAQNYLGGRIHTVDTGCLSYFLLINMDYFKFSFTFSISVIYSYIIRFKSHCRFGE